MGIPLSEQDIARLGIKARPLTREETGISVQEDILSELRKLNDGITSLMTRSSVEPSVAVSVDVPNITKMVQVMTRLIEVVSQPQPKIEVKPQRLIRSFGVSGPDGRDYIVNVVRE